MSHVQWLGQLGAVAPSRVTGDIVEDVIRVVGHVFDLYVRKDTLDCPCWNATYKIFDRSCTECGGTGAIGGFDKQATGSFLGIFLGRAEGSQDQHQRIYAKSGPMDTLDGVIICMAQWFEIIHLDDVLIWKPRGSTTGYELKIISKLPRMGFDNEIIFLRLDVTRNPYPMRPDATDLRKRI